MSQTVTARNLFDELESHHLGMRWRAGKLGGKRSIEPDEAAKSRPSLAGYLNLIHPHKVQIIGREEIEFLDSLDSRDRWGTVARMYGQQPVALIFAGGLSVPEDVLEGAGESATAVWTAESPGYEVLNHAQHYLSRALARSVTLHGVFLEVFSIGVLITGDAGAGKSELALELLSRGHRLIADDAPEFTQIGPEILDGRCPDVLQDCLEVRGLGILNVRALFGDSAVKPNKYLKLVVHLGLTSARGLEVKDRLRGESSTKEVLGLSVPVITLPVAAGRNLAVLVEAAVRNHILQLKGYDAAGAFLERHEAIMQGGKALREKPATPSAADKSRAS